MSIDKNIAEILGVECQIGDVLVQDKPPKQDVILPPSDPDGDHAQEDYELSRKTLREMIKKGHEAVNDIANIAALSESARDYRVLSEVIRSVSETTKDLLDTHIRLKEIKTVDLGDGTEDNFGINVERAVFVGTPADMKRQIKNMSLKIKSEEVVVPQETDEDYIEKEE